MINKIISHYKVIEKLGEGGMGIVYKAEDVKLKRTVALKFLPHHINVTDKDKEQLLDEAKAAATLNHPNICTIHAIGEEEDEQFIVMEYVDGLTLHKKFQQSPLNVNEVVNYAIQIGEALRAAHTKGVIHSDIKSDNIMINSNDQIKVMDFGLAKLKGTLATTEGSVTYGTLSYMSPEHLQGVNVDSRSDIFSFGVVLYEMLTGHLPFKGDYESAVVYSILNEEPEPIFHFRSDLPSELIHIVNRALEKDPQDRYQNIADMLIDLKRLKRDSLKIVYPTTADIEYQSKMEKIKRRLPRNVLIAAGVLFLILVGSLLFLPNLFESEVIAKPVPIAIIHFENQTGDENYNYLQKVIPNLLITKIEQSKYLSVITWERLFDLLKQLGKEDVEYIDNELGFELCQKDGIKALVTGSITKAGNVFVTDVKVLDVNTKRLLKTVYARGEGEESILNKQIDELGTEISKVVGISDKIIKKDTKPLTDVITNSMDAYYYYLRGLEEYSKFYWDDAVNYLEKAVAIDTNFSAAYFLLSINYKSLGETKAFREAIEKAKRHSESATEKDRLYLEAFYAKSIENDEKKGHKIYEEIVKKYPKEKRAHYSLGVSFKNIDIDKSIDELRKAIELDPNFGEAINQLAYMYMDLNKYDLSFKYFNKYLTISPNDANPYDSMGDMYYFTGELDSAIEKYKKAIKIKPDWVVGFKPSYIYALKENYDEAIRSIDEALFQSPSTGLKANIHLLRGFYFAWLECFKRSLAEIDRAEELYKEIENKADIVFSKYIRGYIYFEMGKYELSRRYFQDWFDGIIELNPNAKSNIRIINHVFEGFYELERSNIDSTKMHLQNIKSLMAEMKDEQKSGLMNNYKYLNSEVLYAEGRYDQAIKEYSEIKVGRTPNLQFYRDVITYNIPFEKDMIARAYYKKGDIDRAITEYKQLITLDLRSTDRKLIHPRYHFKLAKLYEEKGLKEKAREEYRVFLDFCKDADENIKEMKEAKSSLNRLTLK